MGYFTALLLCMGMYIILATALELGVDIII